MNNLLAEIKRYGVTVTDVQNLLGCTEKTVRNKLSGTTDFTFPEVLKIRDAFFPGMRLEYLFNTTNEQPDQKTA